MNRMTEAERIAFDIGLYADDELQIQKINDVIKEAEVYLKECGVPEETFASPLAKRFKQIYVQKVFLNEEYIDLNKQPYLIDLISKLRRRSNAKTSN